MTGALSKGDWSCRLATLFAIAGLLLPPEAAAQLPSVQLDPGLRAGTGVGWTMVVPDALLGVGAFRMLGDGNWGVFADGKLTHGSKEDERYFLDGETIEDLETRLPSWQRKPIQAFDEWVFLSAGIVRPLTRDVAVMVGGGMVRRSVIREYFDETQEAPSPSGFYFVKDERESGWFTNGSIAFLMRGGRNIAWSAGFESRARSFSLGAFWIFR